MSSSRSASFLFSSARSVTRFRNSTTSWATMGVSLRSASSASRAARSTRLRPVDSKVSTMAMACGSASPPRPLMAPACTRARGSLTKPARKSRMEPFSSNWPARRPSVRKALPRPEAVNSAWRSLNACRRGVTKTGSARLPIAATAASAMRFWKEGRSRLLIRRRSTSAW